MNKGLQTAHRIIYALLFLAVVQVGTHGQNQPARQPPVPQVSPTPSLERRFVRNILRDQRAIWTAPFRIERADAKWLAPLGISTVSLLATDRRSAGELVENGDNQTRLRISKEISRGGSFYTTSAIAGAFYLIGRSTKNARARETGLLSMEALIDSGIVVTALKTASQRPRPSVDDASGEFFDKGSAFPSGHAADAWSVATVISEEYGKGRPLVRFGVYGLATAVSLSRYTGRNHFLSDVLVGSAIGFGIGRYVYRTHHDPALDGEAAAPQSFGAKSKLFPIPSPIYSRAGRIYGLSLAWNF